MSIIKNAIEACRNMPDCMNAEEKWLGLAPSHAVRICISQVAINKGLSAEGASSILVIQR